MHSKHHPTEGFRIIEDHCYLIQAKRYASHINPAHVQSFVRLCQRRRKKGLFVHTGKTGKKSYQIIQFSEIEIISGDRLLNMLINEQKGRWFHGLADSQAYAHVAAPGLG